MSVFHIPGRRLSHRLFSVVFVGVDVWGFDGDRISCVIPFEEARDGNSRCYYGHFTHDDCRMCERSYLKAITVKCCNSDMDLRVN